MIYSVILYEPPYTMQDYLADTGMVAARSVKPELKDEKKYEAENLAAVKITRLSLN
ncbi:MAG: hypothetical protein L0Z73_09395 [Gammaproteobacteria bacterium]|nr:hypothetical protein [Gammaproteobacteria bacterium]